MREIFSSGPAPSASRPPQRPGWLARLALMTGLVGAPTASSSRDQVPEAPLVGSETDGYRSAPRSLCVPSSREAAAVARLQDAYAEEAPVPMPEVESAPVINEAMIDGLADEGMSLFRDDQPAEGNASDLRAYVRTRVQALFPGGANTPEAIAFLGQLTNRLYERLAEEMDRLEGEGREDYALDLSEAFASWDRTRRADNQEYAVDGVTVESSGQLIDLGIVPEGSSEDVSTVDREEDL